MFIVFDTHSGLIIGIISHLVVKVIPAETGILGNKKCHPCALPSSLCSSVIPAEAGIQAYNKFLSRYIWIPAGACPCEGRGRNDIRDWFPATRLQGHRLRGNNPGFLLPVFTGAGMTGGRGMTRGAGMTRKRIRDIRIGRCLFIILPANA